jgi:two-component SAPR family response regulator
MSEEDPREELDEIFSLYKNHNLPEKAYVWARNAYSTTEEIIETIESMQFNGHDAPTSSQEDALSNIYKAACNWLNR